VSVLIFILIGGVSCALYPIVATIIITRRNSRTSSYPLFELKSFEALPPTARDYFGPLAVTLQAQGFSDALYLYQSGQMNGTTCFLMLMKNHNSGDMACACDMHVTVKHIYNQMNYLEFVTDLSNGVCINSNNIAQPHIFKADPKNIVFKFPGLMDSRQLYQAHRGLVARHAPEEQCVLPSEGIEVPYLCSAIVKTLDKQVEYGYYYQDSKTGDYRPTWKGASLMTLRVAWPMRDIKLAALKTEAVQNLRSLGL
jgi:hypothetical protein